MTTEKSDEILCQEEQAIPLEEYHRDLWKLSESDLGKKYAFTRQFHYRKGKAQYSKEVGWEPILSHFRCFIMEVGRRPSLKHSLDRINGDKPYERGNIRWASNLEQTQNRSNTRTIAYKGAERTLKEVSELTGVSYDTLKKRVQRHPDWPVENLLSGEPAVQLTANPQEPFYPSKLFPSMEDKAPWPCDLPDSFDQWEQHFRRNRNLKEHPNSYLGRLRFLLDTLKVREARNRRKIQGGYENDEGGNPEWIEPESDPAKLERLWVAYERVELLYTRYESILEAEEEKKRHQKLLEEFGHTKTPRRPQSDHTEYYDPGDIDPGDEDPRDWAYQEEPTTQPPAQRHRETFDDLPPHLQESFMREVADK